jgi:hypothetical protein
VRGETHILQADRKALETVARNMLRCPVSLARLLWRDGAAKIVYKGDGLDEQIDACEFVASTRRAGAAHRRAAESKCLKVTSSQELAGTPSPRRRRIAGS